MTEVDEGSASIIEYARVEGKTLSCGKVKNWIEAPSPAKGLQTRSGLGNGEPSDLYPGKGGRWGYASSTRSKPCFSNIS